MSHLHSTPARGGMHRFLASFGALLAGTALAFGTAAPAMAVQNIEPDATGSITVHKFEEPANPTGLSNNGTELDEAATAGLTPIEGVAFTLEQVDVDLTDSADWQDLEGYTVAEAQGNLVDDPAQTLDTNGDGIAAFTNLEVGLYLATETSVNGDNVALQGEPFLVTVPLALDNDWLYDVHVYPKSTVSALDKGFDDSAAYVIGDPIAFTLAAQVPSLPAATPLTAFGITDELDARLAYAGGTVAVEGVELEAADYTLSPTGQNVELVFTTQGLAKLRGVQGNNVTLTLNTTVAALGNGSISNTASLFINDRANTFSSDTVTSSWGALQLTKVASGNETLTLSDAEFALYALEGPEGDRIAGPLTDVTDGDTVFSTDENGTFTIDGLKAGDYELVETKAPLGYRLNDQPVPVTVDQGSLADATTMSVSNEQIPAFELPLTGSTGIALFIGVGVLLVGTGVGLAAVRKARANNA